MIFNGLGGILLGNNRRILISFLAPEAPKPPPIPVPPPAAAPASLASPAVAATAASQRSKAAAASMGGATGSDAFAPPSTAKSGLLGAT